MQGVGSRSKCLTLPDQGRFEASYIKTRNAQRFWSVTQQLLNLASSQHRFWQSLGALASRGVWACLLMPSLRTQHPARVRATRWLAMTSRNDGLPQSPLSHGFAQETLLTSNDPDAISMAPGPSGLLALSWISDDWIDPIELWAR